MQVYCKHQTYYIYEYFKTVLDLTLTKYLDVVNRPFTLLLLVKPVEYILHSA